MAMGKTLRAIAYGAGLGLSFAVPFHLAGDAGPRGPEPLRCWTEEGAERVRGLGLKVVQLYNNSSPEERLSADPNIIGVERKFGDHVITFVAKTDVRPPDGSLDRHRTNQVAVWVRYSGPRPDESSGQRTVNGARGEGPPPDGCPPWSSPVDGMWSGTGNIGGYVHTARVTDGFGPAPGNPKAPCVGDALLDNVEAMVDAALAGADIPELADPLLPC